MKVAVIGGGIAGMSTAYYLYKKFGKNIQIDIHEKGDDVGGLAGTIPVGDTFIEKYYHHIFTHDKYYLELVDDLDLNDTLLWSESKVGYYHQGTSYPFTTPMDLLKFKPLNFPNRIRVGASSLFISRYKNIPKMENMTTEEFMLQYVGQQGWDVIWKPMLRIKFGENYNKIPAVWIWERIVQRIRSRSGGGSKELLGYMQGGFHTLNKKLMEFLRNVGVNFVLNSAIEEIVIEDNKCTGIKTTEGIKTYDRVVCTAALPVFTKLCKNAPETYLAPLRSVNYDCALVVLMELKEQLGQYYWLNISDNNIPFGGLIEHTNLIDKKVYGNRNLVYFSKYLSPDHEFLKMSDKQIIEIFSNSLREIYPDFKDESITGYTVSRDRFAQPIWPMQYSKIKPSYKTPVDNLYLANTSQIYPNDRGMNFSVKLGKEVVEVFE